MMQKTALLRRFLRHPVQVGALCPSSRTLCRAIASGIGIESAVQVVELGPGTGAITREIIRRLPDSGRLLAIELDAALCTCLQKTFPDINIRHDSAVRLGELLEEQQLPKPEVVISGLPWAVFPERLQREILEAVCAHLAPGGCFTTFAYLQGLMLPAGIRFRRLLGEFFPEVATGRIVWKNLPPALIYRCRK